MYFLHSSFSQTSSEIRKALLYYTDINLELDFNSVTFRQPVCLLSYTVQPKTPLTCCKLSVLPACFNLSTNLSISSSCNKSVKIRLVATCHLQVCYNLLKKLAASLWITSFDDQLATSLLTTCNRLVLGELSQAMRTHPDISLWITSA